MKKLMLYGAHDLRLEEIPLPATLGPTQVRFKTLITGVSTARSMWRVITNRSGSPLSSKAWPRAT